MKGGLTQEEEKYELYPLENIPFISKPTPAGVILKKLGTFIKDVDKKYDLDVYGRLVELKAKEKEQWEQEKKEKEKHTFVNSKSESEYDDEVPFSQENLDKEQELPTEVEEQSNPIQRVIKKTKESGEEKKKGLTSEDISQEMVELWPGLELIKDSPNDLALIKEIDLENQEIIFNVSCNAVCGNDDCKESMPEQMNICPYCGTQY